MNGQLSVGLTATIADNTQSNLKSVGVGGTGADKLSIFTENDTVP